MYTVAAGEVVEDHPTRDVAITAAKELSKARHGKVTVEDEGGRESMVYRNGELDSYVFNLRDRRRMD